MGYTNPMGHNVVLVPSTVTYATATARTTAVDTTYSTEGVFILEVDQELYANETITVDIQTYEPLTDDWYTIASFTQVTNAYTNAQQETIRIPYGLGNKISCKWTITGGDDTHKYTITVSGVLK